jgi:hypothetical protein
MTTIEKVIIGLIVVMIVFICGSVAVCNKLIGPELSKHGLKGVVHQIWNGDTLK